MPWFPIFFSSIIALRYCHMRWQCLLLSFGWLLRLPLTTKVVTSNAGHHTVMRVPLSTFGMFLSSLSVFFPAFVSYSLTSFPALVPEMSNRHPQRVPLCAHTWGGKWTTPFPNTDPKFSNIISFTLLCICHMPHFCEVNTLFQHCSFEDQPQVQRKNTHSTVM